MEKTKHRPLVPNFRKFAKLVNILMIPAVVVFVVIIVPSYLGSEANSFYYGSGHIFGEDTRLGQDTMRIEAVFGKSDNYVLMVPRGDTATEKELSDALRSIPQVTGIVSYVDMVGAEIPLEYLEENQLSRLVSDHYSRMILTVDADYEGEETFSLVENVRNIAGSYYPDSYFLAGEGVSTYDLMDTITQDTLKVNIIAIGAVFIILVFMMKSAILPCILVLCIETAIWLKFVEWVVYIGYSKKQHCNCWLTYFQGGLVAMQPIGLI